MATARPKRTRKRKRLMYDQVVKLNYVTLDNPTAENGAVHVRIIGTRSRACYYEGIAKLNAGEARRLAYSLLEASEKESS